MRRDSAAVSHAPSGFSERLISWNGLLEAGFAVWEFLPGMRFNERTAWWRGGADRGGSHEGLDICWYRTLDGRRLSLGADTRVPVICAGEVVSVVADFLGVSLFVAHDQRDNQGRQLHTIYGHIDPGARLVPGSFLVDGDAVGTIADASRRRTAAPSHLHITLALINRDGGPERLDWDALHDRPRVILLDPMIVMKSRFPLLRSAVPECGNRNVL
jgi:hypothetical protein